VGGVRPAGAGKSGFGAGGWHGFSTRRNFNDSFMTKPPLSLFFLLFFGFFRMQATGQVNYRDGYVVRNGDTIRGRIDYSDWLMTPHQIDFQDGTGKQASFEPGEISAFAVGDVVFRSWSVKLYPYSQDPAVVTAPGWSGAPHDTTVFMLVVTGGRLTLYSYRDGRDVPYFFIGWAGGKPEQLRIVNTIVRKGAESDVLTNNLYQYQLADFVKGCPAVAKRPVEVLYEENALSRVVSTYNQCGPSIAETRKGRYRWLIHVLPVAGGLHSMVKVSGNTDAAYAGWPAFDGPTGGLGVIAQLSKGQRRLAIQADVLYDHFSVSSGEYHKNYYQRFRAKLQYEEIKGNLQVRYYYMAGKTRPFVGLGISNSLTINNNSTQTLSDVGNAQNFRQPLFGSADAIRMYRTGAFVSLGAQLRRWVLEGRAEQTQGLAGQSDIHAPVTNFYLLLGYMF